jgi:hypothetical protein
VHVAVAAAPFVAATQAPTLAFLFAFAEIGVGARTARTAIGVPRK